MARALFSSLLPPPLAIPHPRFECISRDHLPPFPRPVSSSRGAFARAKGDLTRKYATETPSLSAHREKQRDVNSSSTPFDSLGRRCCRLKGILAGVHVQDDVIVTTMQTLHIGGVGETRRNFGFSGGNARNPELNSRRHEFFRAEKNERKRENPFGLRFRNFRKIFRRSHSFIISGHSRERVPSRRNNDTMGTGAKRAISPVARHVNWRSSGKGLPTARGGYMATPSRDAVRNVGGVSRRGWRRATG